MELCVFVELRLWRLGLGPWRCKMPCCILALDSRRLQAPPWPIRGIRTWQFHCRYQGGPIRPLIKKANMGGKVDIILLFFLVFGGEGVREIWRGLGGEGHQKAVRGTKKHYVLVIFDEKTLIYNNFH